MRSSVEMDLLPRREACSVHCRSCRQLERAHERLESESGCSPHLINKSRLESHTISMTCCRTISSIIPVVSEEASAVSPETYII
jgi:hypothetical protein